MSSGAIRNPVGWHWSTRSPLQIIPHNRRDQTTPSWSAGQLKSSKSAKSAKLHWKTSLSPWVLVWVGICFHGIQALYLRYNSSHTSILNRPLLPEAPASWSPPTQHKQRISTKKTSTTSWVLVQSDWFLISVVALHRLYNMFHTIILIRELLPRAVVSWKSSISEIAMNNLNNFMSSCPIRINFDFLRSSWSVLKFIPYNRFDPRTPS